jgi:hypothetical protein
MELDVEKEVIPFAIAIEVDAHQTDQYEPNELSDNIPVATGIEDDASENFFVTSNDTVNVPHQLPGAQLIPPKIQQKISRELELNEQVLYTKILGMTCCDCCVGMVVFFIGAVHLGMSFFLFTPFADSTVDLVMFNSFALLNGFFGVFFIWSQISNLISICFTKKSCTVYAITNHRIITLTKNTIRSFLIKDLSDIIIRGNDVVYFQEWLTDPDGNPILNELALPSLDQDGREIVAMLNILKEREIYANSSFDYSQLSYSLNGDQIIRPIVVPPHIEVDINRVLQAGERVVKTVMPAPKHCIFLSPLEAILLSQKTVYIITDRRVIRVRPRNWLLGFFPPPFYEFPPFQPYHVFRRDYPNGTGDVIFAHRWAKRSGDTGGLTRLDDGFFGVANPKDIEKTLKTFARQMSPR